MQELEDRIVPTLLGQHLFPADNAWNQNISNAPVDPNSNNYVNNILANGGDYLHADFGGGGAYGIPLITVGSTTPQVPINFTAYGDESDPGQHRGEGELPRTGRRVGSGGGERSGPEGEGTGHGRDGDPTG